MKPLLVVVTGPAASGKTTVAEALSRELDLPLVAKDAIKETLFDELGTGDREWSRRLGRATFALVFAWVAEQLRRGRSAIVEANFAAGAEPMFAALPPHRTAQLFCSAPREVLIERYAARRRHPGHLDDVVLDELRAGLHHDQFAPLDLGGDLIELDIATADLGALAARIRALL